VNTLALNAGSTSLKFGLFDEGPEPRLAGDLDWSGGNRQAATLTLRPRQGGFHSSKVALPDDATATACVVGAAVTAAASAGVAPIAVVGHRVVHGGAEFGQSTRIDQRVKCAIARLGPLAPLHNPTALRVIEAAEAALPGVPQVAVFDTAFFARLPLPAIVYPVPFEWYEKWGIRRFGFHGLSHAYCAARAAEFLGQDGPRPRLVICHLGGGCSAAAVRNGLPVASTMGFSPLEGLMMGTRSGSVDPGILLHLQREFGLSTEELDQALNYSSGLLGVSGISPDLEVLETEAARGNVRAQLAFDLFADRVRGAVGSLATTLGGLDALVFTDRIGENSPALRAAVCAGLDFMGVHLDLDTNRTARADADLALPGSPARILVLHTREEWMIALEARQLMAALAGSD